MKLNILPIPFTSDDSSTRESDQSGFVFEYGIHKWNVKFKENTKNFISIIIEYQKTTKKENLQSISIPFKILAKFENDFEHIIINHLNFETFNEIIPFFYGKKQIIQVEAYIMPFLPLKCVKNYENIYYAAYCCYFMLNYCDINNQIIETKNKEENNDNFILDQQEILLANGILQSLTSRPISIDLFLFYLNNYTINENDPIPSSYDFQLLDYSPPTIQETVSNIILNYFSRVFNVKLDCFDKVEENSENLSYLSKISNDSIALVFLNPSTYKFDENYHIVNDSNKIQYILYSMIAYEGRNFCLYYYSFNLNRGFKFCENDCIEFDIEKWPHHSSIITIFIRSDVVENFKKQNHFSVYRNNLDQIVTVYQFDYRNVFDKSENCIDNLINELQDKNKSNCFFGHFETTRFSVLSKQNALIYKYDPIENMFPTFPSIYFDDSCLLITFHSSKMRKFVYQLIWFQKVTEQYPKDYFLNSKNELKHRIYCSESAFLPSVQLIKCSNDIKQLLTFKQMINKSPNQSVYWQLAAVKNHCIQIIPLKKEDFSIDLLKFSLVFFACDNPQGMIPIAIRFGQYSKHDSETDNLNIDFVFDDYSDTNIKCSNDDFTELDSYDDNRKLIFYGTPKLVYKKESDFPSFIQLIQSNFENFTIYYRYNDKKNPKRPYKWKQISNPSKDLEILRSDVKNHPNPQQIYHLMLIDNDEHI